MYKNLKLLTILVFSFVFFGCTQVGNDDQEVDKDTNATSPTLVGQFIDAPVSGSRYKSPSKSGITNEKGEFYYVKGESVEFYIGDFKLGSVKGEKVITPLGLVKGIEPKDIKEAISTLSSNEKSKVNTMLQLLQSVDKDNNTSNGIDLSHISNKTFPELNETILSDESELSKIIEAIAPGKTIIDVEDALAHFKKQVKIVETVDETNTSTQIHHFTKQEGYKVINFNNKLYLVGGTHSSGMTNDIYSSSDGVDWKQETTSVPFSLRSAPVVSFNNKLWLIGGYDGSKKNDIYSSSDGVTWTLETNSTAFSARRDHQVVSFKNKLYLIGGFDDTGSKNDIYSSSDGVTWTLETSSAEFSERRDHKVVKFNNKLYLVGGSYNGYPKNDVYSSSDGVHWTQELAYATFTPRFYTQVVNFKNKLYLIGGYDYTGTYKNDIYSSSDGKTWIQESSKAAFTERGQHQVVSFNNKLYLFGGYGLHGSKNDVYASSNGVDWFEVR